MKDGFENLQDALNTIASLPMFDNNIVGAGIKNLIPIVGGFAAFAVLKPTVAFNILKGIGKFVNLITGSSLDKVFGTLEAGGKLGKMLGVLGRIGGKIFIPLTIITTLWETIKGAIDGYKKDGILGMLKGGIDGIVHGLIGGLIETISQGIGWIIDQFGGDGSAFKNFDFMKFIDAFGSNLFMIFDDLFEKMKTAVGEFVDGFKKIFDSDESLVNKIFDMITYPFSYLMKKISDFISGKSPLQVLKDLFESCDVIQSSNHHC